MSQYTELTRNHRTIKFYVKNLCNKCFDTFIDLLFTASMSDGKHCFRLSAQPVCNPSKSVDVTIYKTNQKSWNN